MSPDRYITDAITPEEALGMLKKNEPAKAEREATVRDVGYPAYVTSAGWLREYHRAGVLSATDAKTGRLR